MFHSCLAHIPIFLRREELARVPGWWHLSPRSLEPYVARPQLTPERMAAYDQRRDPFRAYTIRMESILKAWEPIWNRLAQDPSYGQAVRVLFSDHGERFYHVTDQVRLSGIHGYNLDPWETRIMLKAAGPGFDAGAGGASRKETVSVLSLRDAIARTLDAGPAAFRKTLEEAYPEAPMRYHCLDLDLFTDEPAKYRKMPVQDLSKATGIAPGGIWFTRYDKPASERAEEVTVAWGRGDTLEVFRPLEGTGAHRYLYEGFLLKSVSMVSEEEYKAQKEKAKKALKALS
jgi:hypothetical protein